MNIGIVGPADWRARVAEIDEWAIVQWGTDDPIRARELIRDFEPLDAVLVDGSVQFLTSEIVGAIVQRKVSGFALAHDVPETQWIDGLTGVSRIERVEQIQARSPANSVSSTSPDGETTPVWGEGFVIAVWGPAGAPGVTTTAISLAVLAAREGLSVMLCDADSRGASIAIGLGLIDDVPGFAAVCRLAGRGELSDNDFHRLALTPERFQGSVGVLTGIPRASRWAETAAPKARGAIAHLRGMVDLVIADVGSGIEENEWIDGAPQRDGTARAIISDSDLVVAVGNSDAVGISRFIRGLDELTDLNPEPLVVLNKTSKQNAREAIDAIGRFSEHRVTAVVAKDNRGGIDDAAARAAGSMREVWDAVRARIPKANTVANR